MSKLNMAVIAGTTRHQRQSIYAAHLVAEVGARIKDIEIHFVNPAEFDLPGDGNDPEGKDPRYMPIDRSLLPAHLAPTVFVAKLLSLCGALDL